MLKKLLSKKKVTNVGVAELKITAILIVNTALGVTGLVTYTFADMEVVLEATAVLFCIGSGGSNCYQGTDRLNIISITLPATFILLSLYCQWWLFCLPVMCTRLRRWPEMLGFKNAKAIQKNDF